MPVGHDSIIVDDLKPEERWERYNLYTIIDYWTLLLFLSQPCEHQVWQIWVMACKLIFQCFSLQVDPAGLICFSTCSSGTCSCEGDSSTWHICCSLTDCFAISDLYMMKIPFVWKSSILNHTVQQFCWKENFLGCTWWIRMTLAILPCFCFAVAIITASFLSLCCGHTDMSYGFHDWAVLGLIYLTTSSL